MATPLLRSRDFWTKVGYAASALWMGGIVAVTDGETRHPLFRYIFIVPLAGWIVAIAAMHAVKRLRGRRTGPPRV